MSEGAVSNDTNPTSAASQPRTIGELTGHCFGCGPLNPQGLHLQFTVDASDLAAITSRAPVELTRLHEGPPGYIHGGIIATLLDEAMSKLNRPLGIRAMTRNLQVDYLRPSPLGEPLVVVGRYLRREGRKLFHQAELQSADGTVLARGQGLFIVIEEMDNARHIERLATAQADDALTEASGGPVPLPAEAGGLH